MRAWTVGQIEQYAAALRVHCRRLRRHAGELQGAAHYMVAQGDPWAPRVQQAATVLAELADALQQIERGILALPRDELLEDTLPLGASGPDDSGSCR